VYSTLFDLFFLTAGAACRVASLTAKNHFLYAAVKGVILCLNCETMEVVKTFNAYRKAIRSLLLINYSGTQSKPFDRLVSRMSESTSSCSIHSPSQKTWNNDSRKSSQSSITSFQHFSRVSDSLDREDDSNNSVLISFGVGYYGVVKDCINHPEDFILPSEGARNHSQPACPDKSTGRLLLWSTETFARKEPSKCECTCNIPELDEEDEMELPDHLVSGYQ
jgi:hypothetical protein